MTNDLELGRPHRSARQRVGNLPDGVGIMAHRSTIEFLRRRYAAAILRDDADTAGRLRLQLDGLMNQSQRAGRPDEASQMEAARHLDAPAAPPSLPAATGAPGRRAPRLCLVTPVTGLLEWPPLRRCEP